MSHGKCEATFEVIRDWEIDQDGNCISKSVLLSIESCNFGHSSNEEIEIEIELAIEKIENEILLLMVSCDDCRMAESVIGQDGLRAISFSMPSHYIGNLIELEVSIGILKVSRPSEHVLNNLIRNIKIIKILTHSIPASKIEKENLIKFAIECSKEILPDEIHENAWGNVKDLEDLILDHIRIGKPFSFIRCGDGEGRLLSSNELYSDFLLLRELLAYQWGSAALLRLREIYGKNNISKISDDLKKLILASCRSADVIGMPSPVHFRTQTNYENINGILGLACVCLFFYQNQKFLDNKQLRVDTFSSRGLMATGALDRIIRDRKFVAIITHTSIKEALTAKWNVDQVDEYLIPAHDTTIGASGIHYPDVFLHICREIKVPYDGALFLVGAGYLGKVYCDIIKQRGGIALDIGSVFDAWSAKGHLDVKNSGDRL